MPLPPSSTLHSPTYFPFTPLSNPHSPVFTSTPIHEPSLTSRCLYVTNLQWFSVVWTRIYHDFHYHITFPSTPFNHLYTCAFIPLCLPPPDQPSFSSNCFHSPPSALIPLYLPSLPPPPALIPHHLPSSPSMSPHSPPFAFIPPSALIPLQLPSSPSISPNSPPFAFTPLSSSAIIPLHFPSPPTPPSALIPFHLPSSLSISPISLHLPSHPSISPHSPPCALIPPPSAICPIIFHQPPPPSSTLIPLHLPSSPSISPHSPPRALLPPHQPYAPSFSINPPPLHQPSFPSICLHPPPSAICPIICLQPPPPPPPSSTLIPLHLRSSLSIIPHSPLVGFIPLHQPSFPSTAFALVFRKMRRKTQTCRKNAYLVRKMRITPKTEKFRPIFFFHEIDVFVQSYANQLRMLFFWTKTSPVS